MYVCVCNAINLKKVQQAKAEGIRDAGKVFEMYGVESCCGQCINEMNNFLLTENVPTKTLIKVEGSNPSPVTNQTN